jgi:Cysteine rich repeat
MDARRLTLLFALAISGSSAAVAQTMITPAPSAAPPAIQAAPSPALRAACGADVQKFCSGVQPLGRVVECMKGYVRELSPGCLEAAKAEMQAYYAALAR